MPPSARKSSIGAARRAGQKSHVPYRGDDPFVGRKTGISIQPVLRNSDGFEPFDQILGQGLPARKRKKKSVHEDEDEDDNDEDQYDEDGEMSMDVDSPVQNYSNTRRPNTPRTPRAASRASEVDFDEVPSPRPRSVRNQTPGPTPLRSAAGPSRLTAQELIDQDEDSDDYGGSGGDLGGDDPPQPDSPREFSFTEMDTTRNEDDDEEQIEDPPISSPKRAKNTATEVNEAEENGDEDQGMDDMDMTPPESFDEEPEQPKSPPKKQAKRATEKPKAPVKYKLQKENREVPEGVRRSQRQPIAPLEWWRNEKYEFGGREPDGGPVLVPRIKAVIRIPSEPVVPLGSKRRSRRRASTAARKNEQVKIVEKIVEVQVDHANPEEGWDDETETQVAVTAYPRDDEVTRRIAFTAKMFKPTAAANNAWFFQKIFGDGDFIAAGQILIPPRGRKPSKPSKDNTFIFYVIEGAVNLKVHNTSLIVAAGGMFMIPRGNTYFIENIAERDAKLFFTQARKMREGEGDDDGGGGDGEGGAPVVQRAASAAVNGMAPRVNDVRRGVSMHV
ncbi:Mif2/CENP-C like-domain-containing protein [Mycena pura]|uniref:CENP-C homolog n=1 Tax=Mycena pura TaxID=153505 RepID=A0AAD6UWI3_9AGAR|nr:Mif2/CENP-C like-domain-containing protein [Mycena pura]